MRSPRGCAFEEAAGTKSKPKVGRLRLLEFQTPFDLQLAPLLLGEDSGCVECRPLMIEAGPGER